LLMQDKGRSRSARRCRQRRARKTPAGRAVSATGRTMPFNRPTECPFSLRFNRNPPFRFRSITGASLRGRPSSQHRRRLKADAPPTLVHAPLARKRSRWRGAGFQSFWSPDAITRRRVRRLGGGEDAPAYRWWVVGRFQRSDVGSGRNDLVDLVEDFVVKNDLGAGPGGRAWGGRGAGAMDAAQRGLHRHQTRPCDSPALERPGLRALPAYFEKRLLPALRSLLEAAAAAGEARADIEPDELLGAVASLCMRAHDDSPAHARRMVALLIDGLRYGPKPSANAAS
jgi:hypothetical protein